MPAILYGSGLRVSEVTGIKVADVDTARNVLWVRFGKGRKDRQALLPPMLRELLRCYWRSRHPHGCRTARTSVRVLGRVRRAVLDVSPLPNGYAYVFEATSEILSQLARLVDLERQCCAFLTFRIVVEAGLQPICIEITGPPEAKAIIADFFGS
jgi:Phage integrase family